MATVARARSPLVDSLALLGWLTLCLAGGSLGAFVTISEVRDWYPTLVKPSWNPPSWVFGPVWTTLYVMMAIAAWLVWRRVDRPGGRVALGLFGAQLVLNFLWSWLFFGLHSPGLAGVEIVALWVLLGLTIAAFSRVHRVAAALLVPYWAWVTFATALNLTIWRLNA